MTPQLFAKPNEILVSAKPSEILAIRKCSRDPGFQNLAQDLADAGDLLRTYTSALGVITPLLLSRNLVLVAQNKT